MKSEDHIIVDMGFLSSKVIMVSLSSEGLQPVMRQAQPPIDALIITSKSGVIYTVFRDGKINVTKPTEKQKSSHQTKFPL